MIRSTFNRRTFLTTTGCAVAGTAVSATSHVAKAAEHGLSLAPLQGEDGVDYDPRAYASDIMDGFPPPRGKRVTLENWAETTAAIRWAHLNADRVFKTVPIEKGNSAVWVLPRKMLARNELGQKRVRCGESLKTNATVTVDEWLTRNETDAFLVLHNGHIVAEKYFGKMTPQTRHAIWCGSKSFLATILAGYLARGELDEGTKVTDFVPQFAGTGFEGATLRHLLDYVTSLDYEERWDTDEKEWTYGTPEFIRADHDFARCSRVSGCHPLLPKERGMGYCDFLFTLGPGSRPHGTAWDYSDPCSRALQIVLERVTGISYIEHVGKLWQEIGTEGIATLLVDPIGEPVCTYGLFFTARDWARWGQMVCKRGRVGSGDVIPGIADLVNDLQNNPGPKNTFAAMPDPRYRSQIWTAASKAGHSRLLYASGAYHQTCLIDLDRKNVVVQFSSFWKQAADRVATEERATPGQAAHWTTAHNDVALWTFVNDVLPDLLE